jgi:hypothetical protein
MKKGFMLKKGSSSTTTKKQTSASGGNGGGGGVSGYNIDDDDCDDDELPELVEDSDSDEDEKPVAFKPAAKPATKATTITTTAKPGATAAANNKPSASATAAAAAAPAIVDFVVSVKFRSKVVEMRVTGKTTFGEVKGMILKVASVHLPALPADVQPEQMRLGFNSKKKHKDSLTLAEAGITKEPASIVLTLRPAASSNGTATAKAGKSKKAKATPAVFKFHAGQPAEVQDAGGGWHPCTVLDVNKQGLRCASMSLSTIDENTTYATIHFRPSTLLPMQPAEVFTAGAWHPCSINGVEKEGVRCESLSVVHARGMAAVPPADGFLFQASHVRYCTFVSNQPAEVEAAGAWHPCRILAVESNGLRCASGSLPAIDEATTYKAMHFRFCTFAPDQPAEVEAGGVWHPCRIIKLEINGELTGCLVGACLWWAGQHSHEYDWSTHSFIFALTHCASTHSLTHSRTHARTHSHTHARTHPRNRCVCDSRLVLFLLV